MIHKKMLHEKKQGQATLTSSKHMYGIVYITNQLGLINFPPYIFYQRSLGATAGQFSLFTISLQKKLVFTKNCAKTFQIHMMSLK